MAAAHLPGRFGGPRCFSTAILFLLESGQGSHLHRIRSDEIWHFYTGAALTLFSFAPDGRLDQTVLGPDAESGQVFQAVVAAGSWYGAVVNEPGSYSLVGGTVAPGFEFADFELADRRALAAAYPQHRALIERLTPEP
jgi:predicted cupin superfamily sugar epimerase